jgi:hypothetical protein
MRVSLRPHGHRARDRRLPDRLDLPADLIRAALRHGAVFAIDSDSYATRLLAYP